MNGGKIEIKTEGFRGQECQLATAGFEKILGVKTHDEETAEAKLDPQQTHNAAKAGAGW